MKIEIRTDVVVADLANQFVIKIFCTSASVSEWCPRLKKLRNEEASAVIVRPMYPFSKNILVLKYDGRPSGLASIRKGEADNTIEMTSIANWTMFSASYGNSKSMALEVLITSMLKRQYRGTAEKTRISRSTSPLPQHQ